MKSHRHVSRSTNCSNSVSRVLVEKNEEGTVQDKILMPIESCGKHVI